MNEKEGKLDGALEAALCIAVVIGVTWLLVAPAPALAPPGAKPNQVMMVLLGTFCGIGAVISHRLGEGLNEGEKPHLDAWLTFSKWFLSVLLGFVIGGVFRLSGGPDAALWAMGSYAIGTLNGYALFLFWVRLLRRS